MRLKLGISEHASGNLAGNSLQKQYRYCCIIHMAANCQLVAAASLTCFLAHNPCVHILCNWSAWAYHCQMPKSQLWPLAAMEKYRQHTNAYAPQAAVSIAGMDGDFNVDCISKAVLSSAYGGTAEGAWCMRCLSRGASRQEVVAGFHALQMLVLDRPGSSSYWMGKMGMQDRCIQLISTQHVS